MLTADPTANHSRATPLRRFGRFQLDELLGRSAVSMVWRVTDLTGGAQRLLVLPRRQPGPAALAAWQASVGRAARLRHPGCVPVLEVGEHERWPYLLYSAPASRVVVAQLGRLPLAPREASLACHTLCEALAYAHESGTVHGDLQLQMLLMDEAGRVQVMGFEVACAEWLEAAHSGPADAAATLAEADRLRQLRAIARRDVQGAGLLLYTLLSNSHPMDEPDWGAVLSRLPPFGMGSLRLPRSLPQVVPEALRAIVNRSLDRSERVRYGSARTFAHALDGWRRADADQAVGPLAILVDRLTTVGVLPASPGGADKAAKMALMERERTSQLAEVVMQDLALTFELLRQVNAALFKNSRETSSGPVLTVRRAIAMLGLNGVRRAALSLRPWPGPLHEADALELQRTMRRAQRAAAVAQALRPAHWDAEVVAVVTLLQSLGNLLLHYHLPDDVRQIKRLMQAQPVPRRPGRPGEDPLPEMQPGLGETDASLAVLGVEPDAVGAAVARHWGLDEGVALLMRRLPRDTTVLVPDSDDAFLRTLASCSHETLDAAAQPASQSTLALAKVAHRYARALQTTPETLRDALSASVAERPSVPQT